MALGEIVMTIMTTEKLLWFCFMCVLHLYPCEPGMESGWLN
jgi:hypothetical protein